MNLKGYYYEPLIHVTEAEANITTGRAIPRSSFISRSSRHSFHASRGDAEHRGTINVSWRRLLFISSPPLPFQSLLLAGYSTTPGRLQTHSIYGNTRLSLNRMKNEWHCKQMYTLISKAVCSLSHTDLLSCPVIQTNRSFLTQGH